MKTNINCLKMGDINRYGVRKDYSCIDYAQSGHCKKNNPESRKYTEFCNKCKEYLNQFITTCECGNTTFKIMNWRTFCSKCWLIK